MQAHPQATHSRTRQSKLTVLYKTIGAVVIGIFITTSAVVEAQELSDLRWLENEQPVFSISAKGDPAYSTEILDSGYRLRISFADSSLAKDIRDIGEVGIVRGVFPYETDDPNRANFDILLKTEGKLQVVPTERGFQIAVVEATDVLPDTSELPKKAAVSAAPPVTDTEGSNMLADDTPAGEDLSDLERMVLKEIEDSDRPESGSSTDSIAGLETQQTTEQLADTSSAERSRMVLQPAKPAETQSEAAALPSAVEMSGTLVQNDNLMQSDSESMSSAVSENTATDFPPLVESAGQSLEDAGLISEEITPALQTGADVLTANLSQPDVSATRPDKEATLNAITYSQLPGGRIQVNFNVSGALAEPGVFRTNQPPRIVLDFFGANNGIADAIQRIGSGALESIVTAQTDNRTRVILNLVAPVDFEHRVQQGGLVLVMSTPSDSQIATATRTRPVFEGTTAVDGLAFAVEDVDFRRTPEGGGQISVKLSSHKVGVDVNEEAGEIVIDFPGTNLPQELEKRLDVVDFATPVQTIDTFFTGAGARMIISPVGEYSYSSYQVGDALTVQVSPKGIAEEEREPDEFGYSGERLSFNFQRISVRAALQVIADFTGLNFVTSDSVSGDLSLRLQDVPWDQALDTILQVKGLAQRQRGNVVWVAPSEEIASKERQALEAKSQVFELEPLVSELIQINYAKADDIANILKSVRAIDTGYDASLFGSTTITQIETESNSLLSQRGNVTVDSRTNSILVQDTRSKIREVRDLISQLDRPVRQVLIETRIVEAADSFSRTIGVRLGFTRITENTQFPGVGGSNIGTTIGSDSIESNTAVAAAGVGAGGISVDLGASGINGQSPSSYAFTLAKAGAGFASLIDLEISALEAEGTGKVIANPRLLTTDQNEASIKQGQERIFTTSVLGEGGVVTKEATLSLTVTPQITPDNHLVLDVLVTKDTFSDADSTTLNTKQVQTKVLLDNGETVVIGGIYEQTIADSVTKVPLLGDIPILGNLFKKRTKVDNRTELLIFLTPRILDAALTVN